MPEIEIENLSFTYENRSTEALKDVSFKLEKQEFVLIAGPSGSGKSTLLKCINGLIPHRYVGKYSGRVVVAGEPVSNSKFLGLSLHVGTVLQEVEKQIVSSIVEDEVSFGPSNLALPRPEIQRRVQESLAALGIIELRNRFTYALSGGEKQRLAIADIAAMETSIVLFDEPLANLDSNGVRLMQDVFKHLRAQGKTIIVSEHRTEEVLKANPSRIMVIGNGSLLVDSTDPRCLIDFADVLKVPADYVEASPKRLLPASLPREQPKADDLIVCENVAVEYSQGRRVLDDASLTIKEGERIAILGNNGAGKSTLALTVCGLLKPTAGRVLVRGKDTREAIISEIARSVAIVFQSPFSMLFSKTVRSELGFGPMNIGLPPEEVNALVPVVAKECGIEHLLDGSPFASSFGEKKRICVASVLTMQPSCIILDEPTAGQDYRSYTRFMDFVASLERVKSFIIITHDPDLAIDYTDRSIILHEGRVIADGPTTKLLAQRDVTDEAAIRETSLMAQSRKYTGGERVLRTRELVELASGPQRQGKD
ncbi:MAG: energy-coupling factor ABC transporter ATP-binding protein [Thaumarchaeota archaeon]|nr:energy-coupling factor ABC transporter ATP-binding protein [Nitrososphaerota archaeon]